MAWKQKVKNDGTPVTDKEDRYLWVCHKGIHRAKSKTVPGRCSCTEKVCEHYGEKLGEIPCGCGKEGMKEPVHTCTIFGICVAHHTGKSLMRFNGKKPQVCTGCSEFKELEEDSPT